MINELKLVMAAVARKDFVPSLTHFRISDGRVEGFNGRLAISTPTDLDVTAYPKADKFIRALIAAPEDQTSVLNMTAAGRLSVKAGPFRAYVDCLEDGANFPAIKPAGEIITFSSPLLPTFELLSPFMGEDATRPWAMGLLLKGQSAFATNNVIVIEKWVEQPFPLSLNLPRDCVKEMLRIGREPVSVQYTEKAATFHYENGTWLWTALNSLEWPDVEAILNKEHAAVKVPDEFFPAVSRLNDFTDETNRLHIGDTFVSTSLTEGVGASYDLPSFGGNGCYFLKMMALLDGIASHVDFSSHPKPSLFFGDRVRGAIVGIRATDSV